MIVPNVQKVPIIIRQLKLHALCVEEDLLTMKISLHVFAMVHIELGDLLIINVFVRVPTVSQP